MKRFFTIIAVLSIIFGQFTLAHAGSPTDLSKMEGFKEGEVPAEFGEDDSPADIRNVAAAIINSILGLLSIIFLSLIVFAGFQYMTAAGNQDQVDKAKKQIKQGIIGLLIIMSAWGITLFAMEVVADSNSDFFLF